MDVIDFVLRVVIAAGVGASVGLERQWSNKSAGLRTNTLVSLGAAIFVITSILTTQETGDPSRVIGQVVSGMGFLGASVTLWCSAALGTLAGLGYFTFAIICAVFVISINLSFKVTDKWISQQVKDKESEKQKPKSFE